MGLTEFLLERIAEDEAVAQDACVESARWWVDGPAVNSGRWWVYATGEKFERRDVADHIARHDPARVLAECEAKRRIVELHEVVWESRACQYCGGIDSDRLGCAPADHGDWDCSACGSVGGDKASGPDGGGCLTLRALALPYADHPDYRPEWRP